MNALALSLPVITFLLFIYLPATSHAQQSPQADQDSLAVTDIDSLVATRVESIVAARIDSLSRLILLLNENIKKTEESFISGKSMYADRRIADATFYVTIILGFAALATILFGAEVWRRLYSSRKEKEEYEQRWKTAQDEYDRFQKDLANEKKNSQKYRERTRAVLNRYNASLTMILESLVDNAMVDAEAKERIHDVTREHIALMDLAFEENIAAKRSLILNLSHYGTEDARLELLQIKDDLDEPEEIREKAGKAAEKIEQRMAAPVADDAAAEVKDSSKKEGGKRTRKKNKSKDAPNDAGGA